MYPAAGKKIELPFGPTTLYPSTPFCVVHVHVQFSLNSVSSSCVGMRHAPPQLTIAASSSGSNMVLLSVKPLLP